MYCCFYIISNVSWNRLVGGLHRRIPLCVKVVQSLIAMGISTNLAILFIKRVFPHPVGPNNMTFDFSSNKGGFLCVHVRSAITLIPTNNGIYKSCDHSVSRQKYTPRPGPQSPLIYLRWDRFLDDWLPLVVIALHALAHHSTSLVDIVLIVGCGVVDCALLY